MDAVVTEAGIGRVEGTALALVDLPYRDLGELLRATGSLEPVRTAAVREVVALGPGGPRLLPPMPRPGAVWGVGLNYRSKARVTGRAIPTEPILYLSASSSVGGPDGQVPHPEGCTEQLDGEGEIAVVLGAGLYRADEREAWAAVAGITAANDLTARDVMKQTGTPALAKSFPGCTPMGGSVVAAADVVDPAAIGVRTFVNGVLRQDDTSADMIWSIAELLARLSWFAALEPGDVFLTGTPSGTGQDRGVFLEPGDVVTVEVDGVLPLRSTVVPLPCPAPPAAVPVS